MAIGCRLLNQIQPSQDNSILWGGSPHVFVLGGLTFLGRNLIPALVQAGYGVRSLAPSAAQREELRALGCGTVGYGDYYSYEAVKAAAKGSMCAVHCASCFVHYDTSDDDAVYRANSLITSNILKACEALHIPKLIAQSSEVVLYNGDSLRGANETYPYPSRPVGSSARSLQHVEDLVLGANCAALRTVIVRPRLLWGRGDQNLLPALLRNAQSGALRLIDRGQYLTSTCHVSNACEGIICAIKSASGGDVFFLTDGEPMIFADFVRGLLKASGVKNVENTLNRSVPLWIARRASQVAEVLGKVLNTHVNLTQAGVGLIGQEMTFDDSRARQELGYKGSKTLQDGLDELWEDFVSKKNLQTAAAM